MNATTSSASTATPPATPDFEAERIAASVDHPATTAWGDGILDSQVFERRGWEINTDLPTALPDNLHQLNRLVRGQSAVIAALHLNHHMGGNCGRTAAGEAHRRLPGYIADGLVDLSLLLAQEVEGIMNTVLHTVVARED